ncbi:carboxymuconolactone decarboxylase family protein [Maricaulis parjimensis]|uniref:carboxymuconolactone decarboxylase family protein n=1 Tax=Maricaulis parjimensis TaxID=144023 RepID=UPI00193AC903|nr:carboxymuconolactone decarboxylase family protein [Maricaulis parjimensis]
MRLKAPRIDPVDLDQLTPDQDEALGPFLKTGRVLNIFRTLARAPKGLKRFNLWGGYVLSDKNDLPVREREIVILRTGYLCGSGYEWTQHVAIGQRAGLSDDEIEAIKTGADAPNWSTEDAALLRATDDLVKDHFVSPANWDALDFLTEKQRMDLVFTCGQYTQVSMMLNSFGVQLDEGQTLDPDLDRS